MKMVKVLLCLTALGMMFTSSQASLRGYWAFDEGTGTTASDSSAYGNDGTLMAGLDGVVGGTPTASTVPTWISRGSGYALEFGTPASGTPTPSNPDRNWNTVDVAYDASVGNLGDMWSMALWIRHDQNISSINAGGGGGYARVISCPNYEVELGVDSWGYDYFWPYDASPGYPNSDSWQRDIGKSYFNDGGSLGVWYHMAVTFDGTTLKKYINGEKKYEADIPGPMPQGWGGGDFYPPLRFGGQTYPDKDYLIGAMDDIAIWGDAYLDADGVAALYNGTYTPLDVSTIPEPMTLVLLGLGATAVIRRRRA